MNLSTVVRAIVLPISASLVIGHGPHQLRGIEAYSRGIIVHSLGNFLFPYEPLGSRSADVFDGGIDLYALALGGVDDLGPRTSNPINSPAWWESVVAVARVRHGTVTGLTLYPLDLGVALPLERRGIPVPARGHRGAAILQRLATLSKDLGTNIKIEGEIGVVDLAMGAPDRH